MIEVIRQDSGKLLLSVGKHCIECDIDETKAAIDWLAEQSGKPRSLIEAHVTRATI